MILKKYLHRAGMTAGAFLCGLFIFSRIPGLFDGLWEDEVHYNFAFLDSRNFHDLWYRITPIFRPLLDYAVRKWLWFSVIGFPVTEKHLALVALIYAGLHLLIFLGLPWTRFVTLRILSCVLLGLCSVEATYATEAQGYSFYSLAPTLLLFAFLEASRYLSQEKSSSGIGIFLAAWALDLNSHFFAWPMAFVVWAFFAAYLCTISALQIRTRYLKAFLLCSLLILIATYWINKNPLLFLFNNPPSPINGAHHLEWKRLWEYVSQAWEWIHINGLLYLAALASSCLHPERPKRYLACALTLTVIVLKFILVVAMTCRSSYGIADRYLIMFIGPSILAMLLGVESVALQLDRYRAGAGAWLTTGSLVLAIWVWRGSLAQLPGKAFGGWQQWKTTPANYSRNNDFFKHLKAQQQPTLILTNHCWGSDIPTLYMRYIQPASVSPSTVLNVEAGCETSYQSRRSEISSYLRRYKKIGVVAFFYENLQAEPNPCFKKREALYYVPAPNSCLVVYRAKSIADFLSRENE